MRHDHVTRFLRISPRNYNKPLFLDRQKGIGKEL